MTKWQSSLLTNRQREYLKGEEEPSNESQMKKRIRERVYAGFRKDGGVLLDELSIEERRRMFRHWENREDERHPEEVEIEDPFLRNLEKSTVEINLGDLLGFIYFGTEETNLSDFEELLEHGIQQGAEQYGLRVSEFDLTVEFEERLTPEKLFEHLKNDNVSMELLEEIGVSYINTLVQSDKFNLDELPQKYQDYLLESRKTTKSLKENLESLVDENNR